MKLSCVWCDDGAARAAVRREDANDKKAILAGDRFRSAAYYVAFDSIVRRRRW